jgi:uncharacterized protein YciI
MKHFIVEVTYLVPREKMLEVRPEHRAYLEKGYERGMLLMSGAQSCGEGGIVIARAASQSEVEAFFQNDPYQVKQIASYRFVEFEPAAWQQCLQGWI